MNSRFPAVNIALSSAAMDTRQCRNYRAASLGLAILFSATLLFSIEGCSGGYSSSNPPPYPTPTPSTTPSPTPTPSGTTVSVSPNSASVQPGAQQQFSATVTGASNTGVTWTASAGSISSSGLFTAPNISVTVTITAISTADPTKKGFANVLVGNNPINGFQSRIAGVNVPSGMPSIVSSYNFDSTINLPPVATCGSSPCTTYTAGAQSYFTYFRDQPNSLSTDCAIAADGCSMKITILNGYFQGEPGYWDYNFSSDLSKTFGEGQEFYVQYRERVDANAVGTYPGGEGTKHDITTEGDGPNYRASDCTNSPSDVVTIQDGNGGGYPVIYINCGFSGGNAAFMQMPYQVVQFPTADNFLDQVYAGCPHYSGRTTSSSDPTCWNYVPGEWFTVQKHIKVGTFNNPTSVVEIWIAHQGQPAVLVSGAADAAIANQNQGSVNKYGKIQLSAYNTNASWNVNTAVWFDDLIVSTRRIPDPDVLTPNAPDSLSAVKSSTGVTVQWRVNSQNGTSQDDTGFLVERCAGTPATCLGNPQSGFSQIGTTGPGASSFADTTVASAHTYTYRVRAKSAAGNSGYAASVCFNSGGTCGGTVSVP